MQFFKKQNDVIFIIPCKYAFFVAKYLMLQNARDFLPQKLQSRDFFTNIKSVGNADDNNDNDKNDDNDSSYYDFCNLRGQPGPIMY